MPPSRPMMVLLVALVVLVLVVPTACTSGDEPPQDAAPSAEPATAQELLNRAVEWVEGAPTQAETPGETAQSTNSLRVYDSGGLPVMYDAEPDPPFSLVPMVFDGSSYYFAIPEAEGGGWMEVPETEYSKVGDLSASIAWFWLVDPLTDLRATVAEGGPAAGSDGAWRIRGTIDPRLLEGALPHPLGDEYVRYTAGWLVEAVVAEGGELRKLKTTVFAGSPEQFDLVWSWARVAEGPLVPQDAVDFRSRTLD